MGKPRGILVVACAVGALASPAAAAPPRAGGLQQLPRLTHCFTPAGSTGCTAWPALENVVSIAITPNGRFAYVASGGTGDGTILLADRNPATGALTPVSGKTGCYSSDGSSPAGANTCTVATDAGSGAGGNNGYELDGLVISSDGKFLYAASPVAGAVVSFSINPSTGVLTQLPLAQGGCVNATGSGGCAKATVMVHPESLTLSPNGKLLYESSYDDEDIVVFNRVGATGAISQVPGKPGCLTKDGSSGLCDTDPLIYGGPTRVVVSPDGGTLSVASYTIAVLKYSYSTTGGFVPAGCVRDPSVASNRCTALAPLKGEYDLAGSPDGKELYAGLYDEYGVTTLSSSLQRISCTLESPITPCAQGAGLYEMNDLAVAPDGAAVYGAAGEGAASSEAGVVAFARTPSTGALTQYGGAGGCQLSNPLSTGAEKNCGDDPPAAGPYSIAVSPDSNFVYAGGFGWLTAYYAVSRPTCRSASVTVPAGHTVTLHLTCSDFDPNPLAVLITHKPAHGKLGTINQVHKTVTYTPAAGYSGRDRVTFVGWDGTNSSTPAVIRITVKPATLSGLTVAPHKFKLSSGPVKLKISFDLSAASSVTFTVQQQSGGHFKGSFSRSGKAGANSFTFDGRIGSHKLGVGSYELLATPQHGRTHTTTFKLT